MKRITSLLVFSFSFLVSFAQQAGVKMVADGHYRGARQELEHFLDEASEDMKGVEEAEALMLVCDYVLGIPGTVDQMADWTEEHALSPYVDVLRVFSRNLLVKEGRIDEALASFFEDQEKSVSIQTPLAYPLTGLSDEVYGYQSVLYRLAGEKLYDEGKFDKAVGYLEMGEKTRTSQYKQGMCYYNMGQWEKAIATLEESAGVNEDEMAQNAFLHAGIAALQLKKSSDARKLFFLASQMNHNPALREQAFYNYCLTLHEGQSNNTVDAMENFLKEFPTSKWATPISQCLTEVYIQKKDYSKALNAISKVQTPDAGTQADKQKVLYNLAFQELNLNHLQDALAYASQAVAQGKQDVETYAESYYIKGDCNYRLGNYDQAVNDLNTALNLAQQLPGGKLKNHDFAVYSLGYALFKQQKYNASITQFQKVLAMEGVSSTSKSMKADAYNRIGDSYLNMRNYAEANANYALAKETDHALGDYSMLQQAYIEGLNGNYDQKIQMIDQMMTEYPASTLGGKAMYEQGRAYVLSGKEDEATSTFSIISMRYPNSEYAQKASEELANMVANIAIQDSIAKAQELQAIELAKAPVVKAQMLYNEEKYQEAEQVLNQAIDEGIGKPYWLAKAFILLSDIYRAEGRTVEAKQTLESLKANYKEEDDIKDLIEERLKILKN